MLKGETALEGAKCELREETGVKADRLTPFYAARDRRCLYHALLCEADHPQDRIVRQPRETIGALCISREETIRMMEQRIGHMRGAGRDKDIFKTCTPEPHEGYQMLL